MKQRYAEPGTGYQAPARLRVYSEEHELLRQSVGDRLSSDEFQRAIVSSDSTTTIRTVLAHLGSAELLGLKFPRGIGGAGPDSVAEAVVVQELARHLAHGTSLAVAAHSQLAMPLIARAMTSSYHRRLLSEGMLGQTSGAVAHLGSSVGGPPEPAGIVAERTGTGWVINGEHVVVLNGLTCDWAIVTARTGLAESGDDVSLFVIETDTPGFTRTPEPVMGNTAAAIASFRFDSCEVQGSQLLGAEGHGLGILQAARIWERVAYALTTLVACERIMDEAIEYSSQRTVFGRAISKYQVWQHRLADMATELEMARAITEHALRVHASGEDASQPSRIARLLTARLAHTIADESVQIHGGYGYLREYPAEGWWRDTRLSTFLTGTDGEVLDEIFCGIPEFSDPVG